MTGAQELFRAGELAEAIAAQTADVRANPTDATKRWFLAELLCFAGERERADRLLDIIAAQAGPLLPAVTSFRCLLRGEEARRQVLFEGRGPELAGTDTAALQEAIKALMLLRLGEPEAAAAQLDAGEQAVLPAGRWGDKEFNEFRDLDDVLAMLIEVIGGDGEYRWVATTDLVRIELRPLTRPRDLLWRPASITLRDGLEGEVWLPCLYATAEVVDEDALRLGRRTDWIEVVPGLVRGVGLRTFLIGDEDVPVHELGAVEFASQGPET